VKPADGARADPLSLLDATLIRRAHARASSGYDATAVLQAQVREELLARLALTPLKPATVLDVGAGTARSSLALKKRYPKAQVLALDSALPMLRLTRRRFRLMRRFRRVCADAARLPLPDESVDLVFCNLMLQWSSPGPVLRELRRVLRSGGLLALSSCGPDSLQELRGAWAQADELPHVLPFLDMHDLGDAMVHAGFSAPVLDVDRYTLTYPGVREALADLRANGSCNPLEHSRRALTGRERFASMREHFDQRRVDGRIALTFEIVFAHGWAATGSLPAGAAEIRIGLDQLRQQLPGRRRE